MRPGGGQWTQIISAWVDASVLTFKTMMRTSSRSNEMKKTMILMLVIALLVLSFGNAFAGPAPQFGITTSAIKLGDLACNTWRPGLKGGLIVDSSNVYAIRIGGLFAEKEVVMDKSNDGGQTWLGSTGIARSSEIKSCGGTIAIDPVTKALHYAWNTSEPLSTPGYNVYYGNGIITTRVNGLVEGGYSDFSSIAVDGSGGIHIVFSGPNRTIYYTSSSDNGVTFSEPATIPIIGSSDSFSFTADSAGNLFLAYEANTGSWKHYFMKKPAGGSWSSSYDVGTNDGWPSLAVFDLDRIYIAGNGTIAATSNGGQSWTLHTAPGGSFDSSLAVDSNGILNYAWEGSDGANWNTYFARTDKSHDPSRWGQAVLALPEGSLPNIAVDSAGKAYIMSEGAGVAVFTKED